MNNHFRGCQKSVVGSLLTFFLFCMAFGEISQAQIPPPITASGLNTQVSGPIDQGGGVIQHNITGGTRPGGGVNLFHSFGEFGVPTNNIANFLNDSGLPTTNILSRVTGGNPSNIFGTIQTEGFGNSNLFLMNPAGIVFGPNAALNVSGATHFTTADYLRLADGVRFTALPSAQDAILSVAPVEAFGFLNSNPAAISANDSSLSVPEGKSLSLVGGDISISNSSLDASGGQIALASVASPGEILANMLDQASNVNGQSFGALGTVQISEQSVLDVSGDGGGSVLIRGGKFFLDNSTIFANVTGPGPIINGGESIGDGIDIQVSQSAEILTGSLLQTDVSGNATPDVTYGGTHIRADRIEIIGDFGFDFDNGPFTRIKSNVASGSTGGNSGSITLEADSTYLQDFVEIQTRTEGRGNGGDIIFRSNGDLELNGSILETYSSGNLSDSRSGLGNAGNIELNSTHGNIRMTNAPFITSQNFGDGAVGHISVTAPEGDVSLSNFENILGIIFTSIQGNTGFPGTGGIEIIAKNLTIENSSIQIDNFTPAQPGDLSLNLTDTLKLSGDEIQRPGVDTNAKLLTTTRREARSATLNITAHDIILTGDSLVATETFRDGDGGALNIFTQDLEVTNGAQIRSSSRFNPITPAEGPITPSGAGGIINVQGLAGPADSIVINGAGSGIFTNTEGTGSAGSTSLAARQLTLTSGGRIEASTSAQGSGGTINILTENMTISGKSSDGQTHSGVFAKTQGEEGAEKPGAAGNIFINSNNFLLADGGQIDSSTTSGGAGGLISISAKAVTVEGAGSAVASDASQGNGIGGSISLEAENLIMRDKGNLTAKTGGLGDAGTIDLNIRDTLNLTRGGSLTTSTSGAGKAGNIHAAAGTVTISEGGMVDSSTSSTGHGGNIHFEAGAVTLRDKGNLTAKTGGLGDAGTIDLNVRDTLNLTRGGSLTTSTSGAGKAGNIQANTGTFTISEGGVVDSGTTNTGAGGAIDLRASGDMFFSGSLGDSPSSVLSRSTGTDSERGVGGTISLTAGKNFTLSDGATVSANSSGRGNAGSITVTAGDTILLNKASITTEALQASGGNIKFTAPNTIQLVDSTVTSSVEGDVNSKGGNIDLDPDFIILQGSQILAKAGAGKGGNISLVANKVVLVDQLSVVDATAETGVSGTVGIDAPTKFLNGTIAPLPQNPQPVTNMYGTKCMAGEGGQFSSFVDSKTDTVAPAPGTFLASPILPLASPAVAFNSSEKSSTERPSAFSDPHPAAPIQVAIYTPPVLFGQREAAVTGCQ